MKHDPWRPCVKCGVECVPGDDGQCHSCLGKRFERQLFWTIMALVVFVFVVARCV
jgi:hypothetical protein